MYTVPVCALLDEQLHSNMALSRAFLYEVLLVMSEDSRFGAVWLLSETNASLVALTLLFFASDRTTASVAAWVVDLFLQWLLLRYHFPPAADIIQLRWKASRAQPCTHSMRAGIGLVARGR